MIGDIWLWITKHCIKRVEIFLRETFCIHDYDKHSYNLFIECRKCGRVKVK